MSIWEGVIFARAATTTTRGRSAATEPFTLITAVTTATRTPIVSSRGARRTPARLITCWPAQATMPVDSSDSLTTNNEAMNSTVGSPNPASACGRASTPVR
jgi:hypothetical protein